MGRHNRLLPLLATLLLMVCASELAAQQPDTLQLRFRSTKGIELQGIDFGEVRIGTRVEDTIVIYNTGSTTAVRTLSLDTTGSTAFGFLRSQLQSIPARVSDTVILTFTPRTLGVHTGGLILSSGSLRDTLKLIGEGKGDDLARLRLPQRIDFGIIERDSCRQHLLHISSSDTSDTSQVLPIVIESVTINEPGSNITSPFSLIGQIPDTLQPGESLPFVIRYCNSGNPCDTARLILTSGRETRSIPLVACSEDPRIEVLPEEIDFGTVDIGGGSKGYTIRNTGSVPLTVHGQQLALGENFRFGDPGAPTPFRLEPGDARQFALQFTPTSTGNWSDMLKIANNATDTLRLLLAGEMKRPISDPEPTLSNTDIDFGDVHLGRERVRIVTLTNDGDDAFSINSLSLVDPRGPFRFDGLTQPRSLAPDSALELKIIFTPRDTGWVQNLLTISYSNNTGSTAHDTIALRGRGVQERLVVDSMVVVFPLTEIGTRTTGTIRVINTGNIATPLDSGVIASASSSTGDIPFTIIEPIAPEKIPPGEWQDIAIAYRPRLPGTDSAIWRSGELEVLLIGTASGTSTVWLDSAAGNAGEIITLELKADSLVQRVQRVTGFSAVVRFDTRAFYIERVRAAGTQELLSVEPSGNGSFTISGSFLPAHISTGSTLCFIDFRGLSTGQPLNAVSLDSFRLIVPADLSFTLHDGLIALSGCDIGRTEPVARRARLDGLKLAPCSDLAELSFRGAEGAPVSLRIAGIDGQVLRVMELPRASGQDQTFAIPLTDLPPGLLFIELRVAGDRITTPLMLVR